MSIDTMNHEQATSSKAPERYILGELTQEEREAFEGHYFDCSKCFERVQQEMQFLRHAHQVLDPAPEKGWLARMLGDLRRPAPVFATAGLLCAIGMGAYQQVQIAGLKGIRQEERYTLAGESRGAVQELKVPRKSALVLKVEFTNRPEHTSHEVQLETESGAVKSSFKMPVIAGQEAVTISVPADALKPGRYALVVYGLTQDGVRTRPAVGRALFDLQFVD
jgi:hypothetical protein